MWISIMLFLSPWLFGSGERDGFPLPEKVHNARIYRFKPLDCAVNVNVTFKHIWHFDM